MKARITGPQRIKGEIRAPRSKAYTHRALVAALLSKGESFVNSPLKCDDTTRTLKAIKQLGARIENVSNETRIVGTDGRLQSTEPIECGESGATLRFLTAISATLPHTTVLKADRGLANRPLAPLAKALKALGATVRLEGRQDALYVTVQGPLTGGSTVIEGNIS